jgi:hypothetical protein
MGSRRAGVEELLARLVRDLDPYDLDGSGRRLAALHIRELLERCLNDDTGHLLLEMSKESYRHANGFDKISLPSIPESPLRARLHVWRVGSNEEPSDPGDAHNHRWPLASRTLVGSLRNDLYGAEQRPDGAYVHYRHFRIDPVYAYGFAAAGRARLFQTEELITRPGEIYTLSPVTIHQAMSAGGEYTATIALELATVRQATDVFTLAADKQTDARVAPPRFDPDAIRDKLLDLYLRC